MNIQGFSRGITKSLSVKAGSLAATIGIALVAFSPIAAYADGTVSITKINGVPPTGHCIAGPITIEVSGQSGNNGGEWHVRVEWGDGTGTTTVNNLDGHNAHFSFTKSHTPTGPSTGVTLVLYHSNINGLDGKVTVFNQCVAAPSTAVVTVNKVVSGSSQAPGTFTLHLKSSTTSADVVSIGNGVISPFVASSTGVDFIVNPGTYVISENATSSFTPSFGGNVKCLANGNVTVAAGDNITCVVTNTKVVATTGVLHVVKHVIDNNGGAATAANFQMHVKNGGVDVTNSPAVGSETGTDYTLVGGSYAVSETGGPSGYQASFSGDCNGSGVVTVVNGATKTCTITNDDIGPTITVEKTVQNNNGGTASVTSFHYFVDAITEIFNNVAAAVNAGAHTLSESTLAGYSAGPWGGDCAANGSITLALGQNATCTITNTDQPGTLIIKKVIVGSNATPDQFSFQVNGAQVVSFNGNGENDITEPAGTYSVTEVGNDAYTTSYANCSNVALANGGTQTCTITNTLKTGSIVIVKNTVGPDGATTSFNFTSNYGDNAFSLHGGESNISGTLAVGSYGVSETPVDGWDQTSATCDGDGNTPASINVVDGATVTCTFTNTERGHIIVKKVTSPAGSQSTFHFNTSWNESGVDLTDGGQSDSGAIIPGTYNVSEVPANGWNSAVSCDNDGSADSINLAAGETVTCTFTNTSTLSDLSITKSIDDSTPDQGQEVTYTITVHNAGPADASGVVVSDVLPSGLNFVATSSEDVVGNYNSTSGIWTIGSLASGADAVLHMDAMVTGEAGQQISNTATITAGDNDNSDNNASSASLTVNTPSNNGGGNSGGNGGGGGGGSGGGGGGNGPIAGSFGGGGGSIGQVLGASTSTLPNLPAGCSALLNTYMRLGKKGNDTGEVKKLQQFLNDHLGAGLPVNGFFGSATDKSVRDFQMANAGNVLTPWGLAKPTGFVYLTTQRWINLMSCSSLNLPLPELVPYVGQ